MAKFSHPCFNDIYQMFISKTIQQNIRHLKTLYEMIGQTLYTNGLKAFTS